MEICIWSTGNMKSRAVTKAIISEDVGSRPRICDLVDLDEGTNLRLWQVQSWCRLCWSMDYTLWVTAVENKGLNWTKKCSRIPVHCWVLIWNCDHEFIVLPTYSNIKYFSSRVSSAYSLKAFTSWVQSGLGCHKNVEGKMFMNRWRYY